MKEVTQKEAARKKSLGELGELFAIKALVDNKFDKIRNLNDQHLNEPFVIGRLVVSHSVILNLPYRNSQAFTFS